MRILVSFLGEAKEENVCFDYNGGEGNGRTLPARGNIVADILGVPLLRTEKEFLEGCDKG